jgi:pyruvate dehydrogenase E1 component
MQDGMRRMFQEQEDVFYYLTVMNENYEHPEMPAGRRSRHHQGHVPART